MPIITWGPFEEFDRFFGEVPAIFRYGRDLAVDIYEKDNMIIAEMHVSDIDPEKINIKVEDGRLHISGSRDEIQEETGKHYYRKEIRRGSFERIVSIPDLINADKIKAEYGSGVLRIMAPKTGGVKMKKVSIEVKK